MNKAYENQVKSLDQCLKEVQERIPGYSTELTYQAIVEKDGTPRSVEIVSLTREDRQFRECVSQEMQAWRFPVHNPPKPYKVTQSLKFKASPQKVWNKET